MSAMKKWIVGSLTTMVVTAGSLATLAGPAQAYDRGDCERALGTELEGWYPVRWETGISGKVDFGDGLHFLGRPQGFGAICWRLNGGVVVKGGVYADSGSVIVAKVVLTFYNAFGAANSVEYECRCRNGASNHQNTWVGASAENYWTRVRFRLYRGGTKVLDEDYTRAEAV